MPTKKLTESDLEQIQKQAEENCRIDFGGRSYGSDYRWQPDKWGLLLRKLFEGGSSGASRIKAACEKLEPFFEGSQPEASHRAKQIYQNYKYYNELMFNALDFFGRHLQENNAYFSHQVYSQWLNSLRLGLDMACDNYVLSRNGLNYPDTAEPSPRLEAVKEYLYWIYALRFWKAEFQKSLVSGEGGKYASMDTLRWKNYCADTLNNFKNKLGAERGERLFRKVFGSSNPSVPKSQSDLDGLANRVQEALAEELLKTPQAQSEQSEQQNRHENRGEGSFYRNYADEEEERQRRWGEKQRRWRSFEPSDNAKNNNKDDDDRPKPTEADKKKDQDKKRQKSPSREQAESPRDEQKPPKETGFDSSALNDAINKLNGILDEDSKKNEDAFKPSPGLGMPLGPIHRTKEEMENKPWLVMAFDLKEVGWLIKDPATAANFRHGSGDFITLLLELWKVHRKPDFSDVGHNFFWNRGDETKKGFQRLIKDTEPSQGNEETKLLVNDTRSQDLRANKHGWTAWPWNKSHKIPMGIPGVKQNSWSFTRWMRSQHNAYDLWDDSHFIGILRKKELINKFEAWATKTGAGHPEPKCVIWITNQLDFTRSKNLDWWGDDIETINPHNGFSHYLLFVRGKYYCHNVKNYHKDIYHNYIANSNPAQNCQNLAELVGKITKDGNGVLVRLGPDTLNLIESQDKDQKGRSKDETPESRKNNQNLPTDQNLKDMGITREEFELLNTPFADPAKIANIIKKLAQSNNPEKVAEMLDKMFDYLMPPTRDDMFRQMVDNNPVFDENEKKNLKDLWEKAQTVEAKKKVWQTLTYCQAAYEAHAKKTKEQKEQIFEEQVNKNPRYGPPGEDTQERRNRFKEYKGANDAQKEKMQEKENAYFTAGENANQWGNYFYDNANRTAGAGDESVGSESDNQYSSQFSWADSLGSINKLRSLLTMKPEGMEEGMVSNKPYWQIVFNHPLTYIFLFIGIIMAILAAVNKKE